MFLNSKWMKITLSALFSLFELFYCCGSRMFTFIPEQPVRASFAAGFGVFPTQPVRAIGCRRRILHLSQNSLFRYFAAGSGVFPSKPVRAFFCCRRRILRFIPKTVCLSYFAAGLGSSQAACSSYFCCRPRILHFFPKQPVRASLLQVKDFTFIPKQPVQASLLQA